MTHITLNEIKEVREITTAEMAETRGGWFYYNVFNRFYNPFGWSLQNSWINRSRSFDAQHNNFISFLRS